MFRRPKQCFLEVDGVIFGFAFADVKVTIEIMDEMRVLSLTILVDLAVENLAISQRTATLFRGFGSRPLGLWSRVNWMSFVGMLPFNLPAVMSNSLRG